MRSTTDDSVGREVGPSGNRRGYVDYLDAENYSALAQHVLVHESALRGHGQRLWRGVAHHIGQTVDWYVVGLVCLTNIIYITCINF